MAVKKQFSSFQEMLESSTQPILVDFYATWCGPCQMMSQILDQVNIQMGNRVQIVKIDSDKYPVLASQYGVQALPTLILFKNGQLIQKLEGVMQAPQLISHLQSLI
jgi:thioredoxin